MDGGMKGSNMGSGGMMVSNMGSGGMMVSNMESGGMMVSNMGSRGMMVSNMGSGGMMVSNMGSGGMMGSNMGSGGMMGSNMGSGTMMGSNMGGGDMMNCNYDNYMYWRYMNTFNRIMPFMERSLGMRNGGSNYFMGDQMMWCDMMFYCCMESMFTENQSMFSSYPKIMGLYNRVAAHPKICSYPKNRCNIMW